MDPLRSPDPNPDEKFVGRPLKPLPGLPAAPPVPGEPLLPGRFIWDGTEYIVVALLRKWTESAPCTHGSGEKYLRKHWFRVLTSSNHVFTIYFERRTRRGASPTRRWWIYTVQKPSRRAV